MIDVEESFISGAGFIATDHARSVTAHGHGATEAEAEADLERQIEREHERSMGTKLRLLGSAGAS